jgi:tripartite-type tricarboxylate transporter receptor subunit TctC
VHDLLAGHLDLVVLQAADLLPQVRAGNIKAYAVLADTPWAAAPDIPTVDTAGVPGVVNAILARTLGPAGHAEGCGHQTERGGH